MLRFPSKYISLRNRFCGNSFECYSCSFNNATKSIGYSYLIKYSWDYHSLQTEMKLLQMHIKISSPYYLSFFSNVFEPFERKRINNTIQLKALVCVLQNYSIFSFWFYLKSKLYYFQLSLWLQYVEECTSWNVLKLPILWISNIYFILYRCSVSMNFRILVLRIAFIF